MKDSRRLVLQGRAQIVLLILILGVMLLDGGIGTDPESMGKLGAVAASVVYGLKQIIPRNESE